LCLQQGNTTNVSPNSRHPGNDQDSASAPALSKCECEDLRLRGFVVEYATPADMSDGQPLPPLIENVVVWHITRRSDGHTRWRRILRAEDRREVHAPTAHPQPKGKRP
jgi:hypothetical protein